MLEFHPLVEGTDFYGLVADITPASEFLNLIQWLPSLNRVI
jgi:hypothetical protein